MTVELSLEGKVALVTGASRGIGKAIASIFTEAGADVVITGRKRAPLEEAAEEIGKTGRRVLPLEAHSRKLPELERLVDTVGNELGRLDVLVNNAATNPVMGPLIEIEEAAYDVIMDTNVKAYLLLSQLVARWMIEQGGGAILNVSSVESIRPDRGLGAYSISKAAVNMLTRVLAAELGPYGIRVNALAPGVVKTRFSKALWSDEQIMKEVMGRTPLGRIAEPDEAAKMALVLVSDVSSYTSGEIVIMDGGGSI